MYDKNVLLSRMDVAQSSLRDLRSLKGWQGLRLDIRPVSREKTGPRLDNSSTQPIRHVGFLTVAICHQAFVNLFKKIYEIFFPAEGGWPALNDWRFEWVTTWQDVWQPVAVECWQALLDRFA